MPALDLKVEEGNYDAAHHKPGDTIDKIDEHSLASGTAVVAVTTYALAATTEPFASHLDRAALEQLFKPDGWELLLKLDGWW